MRDSGSWFMSLGSLVSPNILSQAIQTLALTPSRQSWNKYRNSATQLQQKSGNFRFSQKKSKNCMRNRLFAENNLKIACQHDFSQKKSENCVQSLLTFHRKKQEIVCISQKKIESRRKKNHLAEEKKWPNKKLQQQQKSIPALP